MEMNKRFFIVSCAPVCCAVMWQMARQLKELLMIDLPYFDSVAHRLAYVVKWLLVPGSCLLVGILTMSMQRFVSGYAISGTRTPDWRSMEINIRYNQNTLEQVILAAIA